MCDELVKRLWECAFGECFNCSQYTPTTNASVCQKELMKQAADAIEELQNRTWRGNVRELRNVVERLIILSSGKITLDDVKQYA